MGFDKKSKDRQTILLAFKLLKVFCCFSIIIIIIGFESQERQRHLSTVFDEDNIAVRAGHHCCQILHKKMKIGSSLRMSFGVYNNKQDIDAVCDSIKKCKKIFKLK